MGVLCYLILTECICDPYGTDPNGGECDQITGQCPCLPNVVGQKCDACASGFWNITSQMGCSSCGCDPAGSTGIECNQVYKLNIHSVQPVYV